MAATCSSLVQAGLFTTFLVFGSVVCAQTLTPPDSVQSTIVPPPVVEELQSPLSPLRFQRQRRFPKARMLKARLPKARLPKARLPKARLLKARLLKAHRLVKR